jgi:hypothetical protein
MSFLAPNILYLSQTQIAFIFIFTDTNARQSVAQQNSKITMFAITALIFCKI